MEIQAKREEEEKNRFDANKIKREKARKGQKKRSGPSFWKKYEDYFGYGLILLVVGFIIMSSFTGDRRKLSSIPVNEDVYIQNHNESGQTYKLGVNEFFLGKTMKDVKKMSRNSITKKKTLPKCNTEPLGSVIPTEYFNFYEKFPNCKFDYV